LVVVERTGKSLRGPARDVLLSEATGKIGHGWGFGVHAAMDQTGAMLGPLMMAVAVMRQQHFNTAFVWLAFPAAGALLALLVARVLYPQAGQAAPREVTQSSLPRVFWMYVASAGMLALGFVDFPLLAFHFEKTQVVGRAMIPLLFSGAMGLNGLTALILGRLFDRHGILVLSLGALVSLLALPLGFLGGTAAAIASIGCWATGMGAQDACLRSGIAQVVSMNKRGSAFGAFNGVYGIMWFVGSVAMGWLYDHSLGALVAFGMAAQLASAAMFFRMRGPLAAAANE
ncbi:MAG: MFS transporter, partial [Candidatus Solibacter sp.]